MYADLRRLLRLYKQQFWYFGWDIRRPEGNLLVHLGFTRTPGPKQGRIRSSRYHRHLENGVVLTLWSFGVCWSSPENGSIYMSRLGLKPRFSERLSFVPESWAPEHLDQFHRPRGPVEIEACQNLMMELMHWFGTYEAEVLALCGEVYRRTAQEAWRDPIGNCDELPRDWKNCSGMFPRKLKGVEVTHPILST